MVSPLRQVLQTYSEIFNFLYCDLIYSVQNSQWEVLAESLETVFDEAHFIVNFHNFLQPLALPRHTFPQVSHLSHIPPVRTTFKTPLL